MADQYWADPRNVAHHLRGALGCVDGAYPDDGGAPLTLGELEVLNLMGTDWADADCAQLAHRLRAPKLTGLVLKDTPITTVGMCAIGRFMARHPDIRLAMPDHLKPPHADVYYIRLFEMDALPAAVFADVRVLDRPRPRSPTSTLSTAADATAREPLRARWVRQVYPVRAADGATAPDGQLAFLISQYPYPDGQWGVAPPHLWEQQLQRGPPVA